MKSFLKAILPSSVQIQLQEQRNLREWKKKGYLDSAPQFVKQNVFLKHGIHGAPWIETGTYLGTTTTFLLENYGKVYSIEPSEELYNRAEEIFHNKNVEMFNGVSETILPTLLPKLRGSINFWLDGHYSAGITYQGSKDCPVSEELEAIANNLSNFEKIAILIDDVKCFLPKNTFYSDYPSLDFLVDWARHNGFVWSIEHDIFVMHNF